MSFFCHLKRLECFTAFLKPASGQDVPGAAGLAGRQNPLLRSSRQKARGLSGERAPAGYRTWALQTPDPAAFVGIKALPGTLFSLAIYNLYNLIYRIFYIYSIYIEYKT